MRICNNKRNPFCRMMLTIYVIVRPVLALVLNKRGTIDTKLTMQSSGEEPSSRGFPMHAKKQTLLVMWNSDLEEFRCMQNLLFLCWSSPTLYKRVICPTLYIKILFTELRSCIKMCLWCLKSFTSSKVKIPAHTKNLN